VIFSVIIIVGGSRALSLGAKLRKTVDALRERGVRTEAKVVAVRDDVSTQGGRVRHATLGWQDEQGVARQVETDAQKLGGWAEIGDPVSILYERQEPGTSEPLEWYLEDEMSHAWIVKGIFVAGVVGIVGGLGVAAWDLVQVFG